MGNQTFTSTGTWVCPSGVSSVIAECWGGGGAGGVASGAASGAGGGAGGQYAIKIVAVTPGNTYTVTVATVAAALTTGGVVVNGTDSWFDAATTVIAKGGTGGADATGTTGAGGAGSTTGGIGDTVFAGGSGAAGVSSTASGGGGGGAGSTGTGNSGSGSTGGAAKSVSGGAGGNGVTAANTRNAGSDFAGGGSGGLSSSATNRAGGNGAAGQVILTWDINPSIIYFPFTNQPTRKLEANKRNLSPGHMSSFSYVQAPSAAAGNPYVSGQNVDPLVLESFQYPSIQEPPYIPPPGPTTPALIGAQSVDLRLPRRRFRYEGSAAPLSVGAPPAETITLDKWLFRFPEPIRRAGRLVAYGVNTAVAKEETPTIEWSMQQPIPRRPRQRLRDSLFGVFTTGSVPSTPAIYIQGQSVDPHWSQSFQFDTLANPLRSLSVIPETITLDKWYAPDNVFRRRRVSIDPRTAFVKVTPFGDVITLDKWLVTYPIGIRRQAGRQQQETRTAPSIISITVPMTWYQPTPVPTRILRELQYLYPPFTIDAAFYLVPSGVTDYLSPAKHIASGILYTSHLGVGVLFVSHSETGELQVSHVDASTLFTDNIGTEP